MNYLIVHKDYRLSIHGVNAGAEMATLFLARYLAREGCRVVIAAPLLEEEQTAQGVEFWDIGQEYNVSAALERAEEELGQYHLISSGRAVPILIANQYQGVRSKILISHDRTSQDTGISAPVLSAAVDKIVCVSNAQREFFVQDMAEPEKVQVIYNGTDQELFSVTDPKERDYNKLVFAGALVQDKGIHLLVESFAQLKQKYPKLTLDVYGSAKMWGREKMFDEREIEKSLPGIVFHGAVAQQEIAAAYKKAGIAVVPSIWFDPFPLTSIEAQVTGCPVVTFNVGGLGEGVIHGTSGIVIEEISVEALTAGLDSLLSDPARLEQMSRAAIEQQRPKYTWERVAREIIKVSQHAAGPEEKPETDSRPVGVFTTWNQECGLATYARYLFSQFEEGSCIIFAEDTIEADSAADEWYVERCWKSKQQDWSQFLRKVEESDIGLLHLNIHNPMAFPVGPFVRAIKQLQQQGRGVFLHLHSIFTLRDEARELFECVDGVIVHTPEVRLEAIANGAHPDTTVALPHGIDVKNELTPRERSLLRQKLRMSETEKAIVCFGFIQPHKGIEDLIQSVAELRQAGVDVKGYVAGKPNQADPNAERYAQELQMLAERLGVSDKIVFLNRFLPNEEVTEYLQASDLVLMNYRSQHFEASGACSLALGAGAVVATSLAPPFIGYGDAVWHISSGFPTPLALRLLLDNEALRLEVQEQGKRYANEHSWQAIARQLKQIYQACGYEPACRNKEKGKVETQKNVSGKTAPRILIQNRSNMYAQRGGDTVVVERLVAGLQQRGIEVCVDLEAKEDPAQYDLVHLVNFALPQLLEPLAKRAEERGVPFVVTTLCEDLPMFHNQSIVAAQQLIEYVQRGQDSTWLTQNWQAPQSIQPCEGFQNGWVAEHAKALFVNGECEAEVLRKTYPQSAPIMNIPIGYEVGAEASADLFINEYGVRDFVFCVGRFETRKNQLMLLKALEDLDMPVVLASGGFSYQAEYDQAVRNFQRKGKTIILERVSAEMLASAYAAAKVHVLPSWYELPGLVSLEAAAHGCNVVVTEYGTARDYFGDYAFYCDPADASSVRNAVLAGYYAPVSPDLATIARSHSWEQFAESTIRVYESLIPQVQPTIPATIATTQAPQMESSPEVHQLVEEGQEAARKKDFTGAHNLLAQAEQQAPQDLRVVRNRAAVYMAENNREKAEEYFRRAYAIVPTDPRTLSGLGMCAMMRDCPEEAYSYFTKALEGDKLQMVAILQLMECSYRLRKFEDLNKVLAHYVSERPEEADMRFCYAGCLYQRGEKREALAQAEQVLQTKETHRGALELKTQIEKDFQSQAPTLEKEIVEAPVESSAEHRTRAFDSIDAKLDELEEAKRRRTFDQVIEGVRQLEKNPTLNQQQKERLLILSAEVRALEGERDEALDMFRDILRNNQESARALCGIGAIQASLGDWARAQEEFEKALGYEQESDVALAGLGMCASVAGDDEQAWQYYQQSFWKNPENIRALYGIIEVGYSTNRLAEIERAVREYLDHHPADLHFLYSLAGCYYAQEKLEDALTEVNKILLFDRENQNARELQLAIQEKMSSAPSPRI